MMLHPALLILLVTATVAASVAATVALAGGRDVWRRRRGWLATRERRRVIVHTVHGQTLSGVLDVVAPDGVVLRPATLHQDGAEVDVAGGVHVPREHVRWTQHPDTPA